MAPVPGVDVRGASVDPSSIDPVVAGAAVAVAVLVLYAVWRLIGWYRRPPAVRFRGALRSADAVTVLTHPNPDPDAMSSALAVARLARSVKTEATVQYPGQVRHQENRAFRTVLDVEMDRIEGLTDLTEGAVVLVDHNEPRGFAGADAVVPYAVVDHHPGDGEGSAFTDVRPDYGACASILAEYFETLDAEVLGPGVPDPDDGLTVDSRLATALMYGIQSDTAQLTRGCSAAEFRACEYLQRGIDEDLLDRIANPQVDAGVLDAKARAIDNRTVEGSFAVSDLGPVTNADAVPQSADELMRLEGVTAVVVYGEFDDTIHISGRSRDDRVHMGNALEAAVEEVPRAAGGGHARMGGGRIDLEPTGSGGAQAGVAVADLDTRLFEAMRGDRQ